jgi:hypothetical protein
MVEVLKVMRVLNCNKGIVVKKGCKYCVPSFDNISLSMNKCDRLVGLRIKIDENDKVLRGSNFCMLVISEMRVADVTRPSQI